MEYSAKTNNTLGYELYIITLLFTILSVFLQSIPIETAEHFKLLLHIDSTQFVNLGALFFTTYSLMQIPGGMLFDKYGLRVLLPSFILITVLSFILFWFSNSSAVLGTSRIISGLGSSVAYTSTIFVAARYFSPKKLPFLIGLLEATATTGSMLAANPLHWLLERYGWNITGILFSILFVVLSIMSFYSAKKITVMNEHPQQQVSLSGIVHQIWLLLKNKVLVAVFIYSFLVWFIIMSFAGYWLKEYLVEMHHYSANKALSLVEVYWLSFFIASLIIGYIANNYAKAKLVVFVLAIVGFLSYLFMSIPILFNYIELFMVVTFAGISATGVIVAFSLVPRFAKPEFCGAAIALNNTFVVLGGYVGQLLFGFILKKIDLDKYIAGSLGQHGIESHYYSALLLYLLISILTLICAIIIFRQKQALE